MSEGEGSPTAPTPQQTYKQLVECFHRNAGQIAELEVLPSSFLLPEPASSAVLQDGASLAIRKRDLAGAFLVARKIYFENKCIEDRPLEQLNSARDATSIMLFFDPEHLTAANWRKQYLSHCLIEKHVAGHSDLTRRRINYEEELAFLASLLTSPLKRHTKSPTLWSHRFWVMKFGGQMYEGGLRKMREAEHEVALRAADKHFANYYAFDYLRRLARWIGREAITDEHGAIKGMLQKWCLAHPKDISGWTYLLYLLEQNGGLQSEQAKETLAVVKEFVQKVEWEGASVDWFLKTFDQQQNQSLKNIDSSSRNES